MITNPTRRYEARPLPDTTVAGKSGMWGVWDDRAQSFAVGEKGREEWAKARAHALNHAWERTLP